ncbi:hypothetical protein QL285_030787 [Trifolium repens]|nr:hypothetical protein QL285_030787 [Trifolium repens]
MITPRFGGGAKSNGPRNERSTQGEGQRAGPHDRGFTRLTYNELMDLKKKGGLCFKCKQPFHPMHQCSEKHLRVMVVDDETNGGEEGDLLAVEIDEEEVEEKGEMSVLDLYHIAFETHHTMKFQGSIHGVEV